MGKFYYRLIPGSDVDPGILRQSNRALHFCLKDLGLPGDIYIQWCRAVSKADYDLRKNDGSYKTFPSEFYGSTSSNKRSGIRNRILLRADIELEDIIRTICHECKHIADRNFYGDDSITWHLSSREYRQDPSEIRANEYADRAFPEIRKQVELLEAVRRITMELEALRDGIS